MIGSPRPEPPLEILDGLRHPVPMEESSVAEARRLATIQSVARAIRNERGPGRSRVRRLGMWAAAAALVLAGLGGVGVTQFDGSRVASRATAMPPTEAGGDLRVSAGLVVATHQGTPTAVRVGSVAVVRKDDEIQSAADGEATLSLPRGVRVDIGGSTKARVLAVSDHEQRLRCDLGTTRVSVPKPGGPRTFAVETPDAEVIVHGTEFSVLVERGASNLSTVTSVAVTRGAVLVVYRGEQRLVAAGDHWSSLVVPPVPPVIPAAPVAEIATTEKPPTAGVNRGGPPPRRWRGALGEQNRLFRAALDARKTGDDARAVEYLDELLTRFPNTTLAHEARLARLRALGRGGQASEN